MSNELSKIASELLTNIRDKGPLVWNFSNFVSMDIAANALLSIGASPAMAHAKEEAKDFSQICKAISGALTINIGTFVICVLMLLIPSFIISKVTPIRALRRI